MLFLLLVSLFGETGEGQAFLWLFNTILLLCLISLCSCYGLCGFCFWAAILQRYLPTVDDCNLHLSLVQFWLFYWCACMFIRRPLERSCVVLILFWFRLSWSTVLDFLVLPSFCFVLSCRTPKHEARLAYPVLWYSCSPRTHHVPHGSCGPWKHLLARSGFVELVPVVVHFPQLMWLLAFSVTFASLACKKTKWTPRGSFSAMFACSHQKISGNRNPSRTIVVHWCPLRGSILYRRLATHCLLFELERSGL